MKKLYLLRHAKSSWENLDLEDFDRPLNNRGKNQLLYMKEFIIKNKIKPELILCSTSNRTKLTNKGIFNKENTIYMDNLYHASNKELQRIIKSIDNKINNIMIIGHNPGLNEFAYELINFQKNIQTASLLEIDILVNNWDEINSKNSRFISYTNPPKKN
ncbi:SixA phosphatase family protein [Arcobacter sp.]|uniref:SixA phosphatase family protein n=1 Tax=Arcobacter sp. TaxID=1872629 RepID=UPI003D097420